MKKIVALVMTFILLQWCIPAMSECAPEYKNVQIVLNGNSIALLNEKGQQRNSIIVDGIIYVPIDCFINSIGGEANYDKTANQITITLDSVSDSLASDDVTMGKSAYLDADITEILFSGRWTRLGERGNEFFEFSSNHTGNVSGVATSTWSLQDGIVTVNYSMQGHEWHRKFNFKTENDQFMLVDISGEYILNAKSEGLVNLLGAWYAVEDGTVILGFSEHACFLETPNKKYTGTWAVDADNIFLRLATVKTHVIAQYNGASISLSLDGKDYAFTR